MGNQNNTNQREFKNGQELAEAMLKDVNLSQEVLGYYETCLFDKAID